MCNIMSRGWLQRCTVSLVNWGHPKSDDISWALCWLRSCRRVRERDTQDLLLMVASAFKFSKKFFPFLHTIGLLSDLLQRLTMDTTGCIYMFHRSFIILMHDWGVDKEFLSKARVVVAAGSMTSSWINVDNHKRQDKERPSRRLFDQNSEKMSVFRSQGLTIDWRSSMKRKNVPNACFFHSLDCSHSLPLRYFPFKVRRASTLFPAQDAPIRFCPKMQTSMRDPTVIRQCGNDDLNWKYCYEHSQWPCWHCEGAV